MMKIMAKIGPWSGFICILVTSLGAWGQSQGYGNSNSGWPYETYHKRSAERFDILTWIAQTHQIQAEQNLRLRAGGSSLWFTPDLVLQYAQESNLQVTRDGTNVGTVNRQFERAQLFLDNFISVHNKKRNINIDVGVEGFYSSTGKFLVDSISPQSTWDSKQKGVGLMFRPFGRSSQDTGLIVKGGYMAMDQSGMWANATNQISLSGIYLGAEAKLYLLPFLGAKAEYNVVLPSSNSELAADWQMQRFQYGGFLELFILDLEAYAFSTDYILSPNSGAADVHDREQGVGLGAELFF